MVLSFYSLRTWGAICPRKCNNLKTCPIEEYYWREGEIDCKYTQYHQLHPKQWAQVRQTCIPKSLSAIELKEQKKDLKQSKLLAKFIIKNNVILSFKK